MVLFQKLLMLYQWSTFGLCNGLVSCGQTAFFLLRRVVVRVTILFFSFCVGSLTQHKRKKTRSGHMRLVLGPLLLLLFINDLSTVFANLLVAYLQIIVCYIAEFSLSMTPISYRMT